MRYRSVLALRPVRTGARCTRPVRTVRNWKKHCMTMLFPSGPYVWPGRTGDRCADDPYVRAVVTCRTYVCKKYTPVRPGRTYGSSAPSFTVHRNHLKCFSKGRYALAVRTVRAYVGPYVRVCFSTPVRTARMYGCRKVHPYVRPYRPQKTLRRI